MRVFFAKTTKCILHTYLGSSEVEMREGERVCVCVCLRVLAKKKK